MNPTTSTINPTKQIYNINGTKVRATSQDEANNLAQEITTEKNSALTVPTPRNRPVKDTSSTSSFTESPVPQPKSVESITSDMLNMAQGELSYLDNYYKQQLDEQKNINAKNDRSTQAISTLTGLAGSTEADVAQQRTTAAGQKANQAILNEAKAAAQAVYGRVSKAATEEARAQRLEARQTEQERIANRAARQQQAVNEVQNISASGITLDGLKKTDRNTYDYLVRQFGSEEALKGAYVLNTPQDQILDKRIENGKYIIARQNPLTGKTSIESIDLKLPTGYSKTIDAGDKILAIPDNWDGDTSKLISISKNKAGSATGTYTPGADPSVDSWVNLVKTGQAKITNVPKNIQNLVAQGLGFNSGDVQQVDRFVSDAITIVDRLLGEDVEKLENVVGPLSSKIPTVRGGSADVLADLDRLKAILTKDNLKYMKGLGAMSDREFQNLQNISDSLKTQRSEAGFKKELQRIRDNLTTQSEQGTTDPYANFRSQLQPGEMMVLRDGNVVAITQNELLPTDQQL